MLSREKDFDKVPQKLKQTNKNEQNNLRISELFGGKFWTRSGIGVNSFGQFDGGSVEGHPGFFTGRKDQPGRQEEAVATGIAQLESVGVLDASSAFHPID